MDNTKRWSSATPGLLVIQIDQSGSMLTAFAEGKTRSEFASLATNRLINDLIQRNYDGKAPKDRCYVVVIGYGDDARILTSGYLSELEASPLRIDEVKKKISDGAGGLVETAVKMPLWVDPTTSDELTNMPAAMRMTKEIIQNWVKDHHDTPAPVVVNITDGAAYYGGKSERECMDETLSVASEIKKIATDDGHVQIFSAMIGNGTKIIFPDSPQPLSSQEGLFLYELATEIPKSYRPAAEKNELHFTPGAHGMFLNADAELLVKLINFGSSKGLQDIA